jgi:predicted phage tail protein
VAAEQALCPGPASLLGRRWSRQDHYAGVASGRRGNLVWVLRVLFAVRRCATLGAQAVPIVAGSIGCSPGVWRHVADLLTPTPKMPNVAGPGGIGSGATSGRSREEQERSFTFDKSNANTQQGEVVPVLYGERIIGSLPVLSFGLELQNSL